jgi:hypothetical protein
VRLVRHPVIRAASSGNGAASRSGGATSTEPRRRTFFLGALWTPIVTLRRLLEYRPFKPGDNCGACNHFHLKGERWGHCVLMGGWVREDLGCFEFWKAPRALRRAKS